MGTTRRYSVRAAVRRCLTIQGMRITDQEADRILHQLGKTPAPIPRRGVQEAWDFFDRYLLNMGTDKRLSYLKAMDLSKPVQRVDLCAGDEVIAFRFPDAEFGEFHTRAGSDPSQLGIQLGGRAFRRFVVIQRVAVLSAHTGAFSHSLRGSGGAEQLIIPNSATVLRIAHRAAEAH